MENILNKKESGWKSLSSGEMDSIMTFSDNYIKFLNRSKTEREANKSIILELEKHGFRNVNDMDRLSAGDKQYMVLLLNLVEKK